jgi:hypothetical protein
MSFKFSGTSGCRIYRNSGNVSNTNAFTEFFWVKRTANFTDMKFLSTLRPTGEATGHDLVINDPSFTAYTPSLQANYATATAVADDPLALNTWTCFARVGSGANLSLKYWDGSAWVTDTVGQTAFVPAFSRFGSSGYGAEFTGLIAHIRFWNVALTDTELSAERLSETRVKTTSFLSAHNGAGTLAQALTGQTGTAFVAGGDVTVDADAPTFSTFDGMVVSGESDTSDEITVVEGSRYNWMLYSGDLSNAVWSKQGNEIVTGAATPPTGFGTAQRGKIRINTGGIYQLVSGIPGGVHTAAVAVRRVDTDFVAFRHMADDFGSGAQGHFNRSTAAWTTTGNFGDVTDGTFGSRSLGNSWYLIWISATVSGNRIIEFFPITTNGVQLPAVDKHVDVSAFQLEAGSLATYHKPTTSASAARELSAISVGLATSTLGAGQATTVTATLLDESGAPWDQYADVEFDSSNELVATVAAPGGATTDYAGRMNVLVTAVANGTTSITASTDDLTSTGATLTVSSSGTISSWVRVVVEGGWEGTTGWAVGVYRKHATGRFPREFMFEALNQRFEDDSFGTDSYMDVPVPTGTSVTSGQIVEVALENDGVGGKAVDGPGIFSATIISA